MGKNPSKKSPASGNKKPKGTKETPASLAKKSRDRTRRSSLQGQVQLLPTLKLNVNEKSAISDDGKFNEKFVLQLFTDAAYQFKNGETKEKKDMGKDKLIILVKALKTKVESMDVKILTYNDLFYLKIEGSKRGIKGVSFEEGGDEIFSITPFCKEKLGIKWSTISPWLEGKKLGTTAGRPKSLMDNVMPELLKIVDCAASLEIGLNLNELKTLATDLMINMDSTAKLPAASTMENYLRSSIKIFNTDHNTTARQNAEYCIRNFLSEIAVLDYCGLGGKRFDDPRGHKKDMKYPADFISNQDQTTIVLSNGVYHSKMSMSAETKKKTEQIRNPNFKTVHAKADFMRLKVAVTTTGGGVLANVTFVVKTDMKNLQSRSQHFQNNLHFRKENSIVLKKLRQKFQARPRNDRAVTSSHASPSRNTASVTSHRTPTRVVSCL